MKIALLQGGMSAEREVSLTSGTAVENALRELGYDVHVCDVGANIAAQLSALKPDIAFNALHGRYGEDGCMQGILETLKIPYTHSGVLASALAMDKPMAKRLFADAGLHCAEGKTISKAELKRSDPMARPYVVKPLNEGSSVGVVIVEEGDNLDLTPFGDTLLIERYVPGREIQVAVLDDEALGAIEICPKQGFYDYEAKYTDGKADHLMPAPLEKDSYRTVCDMAVLAHKTLGCRGLTRTDFRYDGEQFYILEVNTQPGMTPLSLAPEIAAHKDISFNDLVERLVKGAQLDG